MTYQNILWQNIWIHKIESQKYKIVNKGNNKLLWFFSFICIKCWHSSVWGPIRVIRGFSFDSCIIFSLSFNIGYCFGHKHYIVQYFWGVLSCVLIFFLSGVTICVIRCFHSVFVLCMCHMFWYGSFTLGSHFLSLYV